MCFVWLNPLIHEGSDTFSNLGLYLTHLRKFLNNLPNIYLRFTKIYQDLPRFTKICQDLQHQGDVTWMLHESLWYWHRAQPESCDWRNWPVVFGQITKITLFEGDRNCKEAKRERVRFWDEKDFPEFVKNYQVKICLGHQPILNPSKSERWYDSNKVWCTSFW